MDSRVGLELDVRCLKEVVLRPEVLERAKAMLGVVMSDGDCAGIWRFDVVGECKTLPNPSQYWIAFAPASDLMPRLVHVSIRSSLIPNGTLSGMLRLSDGVDRTSFLSSIIPLANARNAAHWKGVLEPEMRTVFSTAPVSTGPKKPSLSEADDREPVAPGRFARAVPIDGRAMIDREWQRLGHGRVRQLSPEEMSRRPPPTPPPDRKKPPARMPSRLSSRDPVRPHSQPIPPRSTAMSDPVHAGSSPHEAHARLLEQAIQGKENGVFSGKDVAALARERFPAKAKRWHSTGCTMELIGLKWIRQVGPATYQVEQSFIDLRGLVGIEMSPLPKTGLSDRTHPKAKSEKRRTKKTGTAASPPDSLAALLAERDELEGRVAAAQAELAAFDERLRSTLGPLVKKLYPERSAG